jgi:hypothetical protein
MSITMMFWIAPGWRIPAPGDGLAKAAVKDDELSSAAPGMVQAAAARVTKRFLKVNPFP